MGSTIKIYDIHFKLDELFRSNRDSKVIQKLIIQCENNFNDFTIYEPLEEDIHDPYDNWACYGSESNRFYFEFLSEEMCYIAYDPDSFQSHIYQNDCFTSRIIKYDEHWLRVLLSSKHLERNALPNRYIPFLETDWLKAK